VGGLSGLLKVVKGRRESYLVGECVGGNLGGIGFVRG
jgi:hypothetical protein